jgi:hypothetical protein
MSCVGQIEDLLIQLGLPGRAVSLHLQVVAILEEVGVPLRGLSGAGRIAGLQMTGNLAGHAC